MATTLAETAAFPSYLGGAPAEGATGQDPRFSYGVFGQILDKPYTQASPFLADDPFVAQMNALYKYKAPDLQPLANVEGGAGFDFSRGMYGSWDLGGGNVFAPKWSMKGQDGSYDPFFTTLNDFSDVNHYQPFNPDGTVNPANWAVRSTKSQALGHVLGTLGVLGAAAGGYFLGPGAGAGAAEAGAGTAAEVAGTAAAPALTETGATGLASLGSSVLPASEAFGVGGGTLAQDAALAAGSSGTGSFGGLASFGPSVNSAADAFGSTYGTSAGGPFEAGGTIGELAPTGAGSFTDRLNAVGKLLSGTAGTGAGAGAGNLYTALGLPAWTGTAGNIGTTLYGLYQGSEQRRRARELAAAADPFRRYRAGYGEQLAALEADPSSITSRPGYQFQLNEGLQAIKRRMAASGYAGAGNEAIALNKYAQDYAGTSLAAEQARLAQLAGAGFNPLGASQLSLTGQQSGTELALQALNRLGYYQTQAERDYYRNPQPYGRF